MELIILTYLERIITDDVTSSKKVFFLFIVPLVTLNVRLIECCCSFELMQLVCCDTSLKTKMSDRGLSIVGNDVPYV